MEFCPHLYFLYMRVFCRKTRGEHERSKWSTQLQNFGGNFVRLRTAFALLWLMAAPGTKFGLTFLPIFLYDGDDKVWYPPPRK